jgi:hypothetical protein
MLHTAFVDFSPACCCTFMGPELYFLDLVWHGLRVIGKTNGVGVGVVWQGLRVIGKTNGGGGECSGSEACMDLFLGPAGQGFEGDQSDKRVKRPCQCHDMQCMQ